MLNRKNLGGNLKIICKRKGISRTELARMAKISEATVGKIMNGVETIKVSTLTLVANSLGVTVEELSEDVKIEENQLNDIVYRRNIARSLEIICKRKGISKAELARIAGVYSDTIYRIMNCESVKNSTLKLVASALEVTIEQLEQDMSELNEDPKWREYVLKNIEALMFINGTNRREVEIKAEFVRGNMSKLLDSKMRLKENDIKKIAEVLGVTYDDLIHKKYWEKTEKLSLFYLGANLLGVCRQRQISFEELANMSGLSITTIKNVIRGKGTPYMTTVKNLATALSVSIETLLTNPAE
ncbi:MAG: helix-turn-helix domain-containing protein [Clostridia bacterium]|nr:helix-turn-helix domain-containing protein [Clostridia bacterium]